MLLNIIFSHQIGDVKVDIQYLSVLCMRMSAIEAIHSYRYLMLIHGPTYDKQM